MSIRKICECDVKTLPPTASISEAASLMKKHDIGTIVAVENSKPVGIVTDRDMVINILINEELSFKDICVKDIMSCDLLLLNHHQPINEAIDMMCAKGVRRAPIIDDSGKLVGITSVDDLFMLIADEAASLAKLIRKQAA